MRNKLLEKQRREAYKITAVCIRCQRPNDKKTTRCSHCTEIARLLQAKLQRDRKEAGLCITCKQVNLTEDLRCGSCLEEQRLIANKRKLRYRASNKCVYCGDTRDTGTSSSRCSICIIKDLAQRHLGSSSEWTNLKHLLAEQEFKCALTQVPLILSENASVDHKIPLTRGGKNELENLHWVTWLVNRAKSNLTVAEFQSLCTTVIAVNGCNYTTLPAINASTRNKSRVDVQ